MSKKEQEEDFMFYLVLFAAVYVFIYLVAWLCDTLSHMVLDLLVV